VEVAFYQNLPYSKNKGNVLCLLWYGNTFSLHIQHC